MSNREDQCRPRWSRGWHCFRGVIFPMLPSFAVNIYHIVLNVNEIHCLHYVWFQSNQGRVNVWVCVSHFVNQLFIRRQAESMVNRSRLNSAQSIFFGILPVVKQYQPLPRAITFRAWFDDSAGGTDFFQMSLSQSESTILHEGMKLTYTCTLNF